MRDGLGRIRLARRRTAFLRSASAIRRSMATTSRLGADARGAWPRIRSRLQFQPIPAARLSPTFRRRRLRRARFDSIAIWASLIPTVASCTPRADLPTTRPRFTDLRRAQSTRLADGLAIADLLWAC